MPYRIIQIRRPYDHRTPEVTVACYEVVSGEYATPEDARKDIKLWENGEYPNAYAAPADWFIVIQTF
jgi:hypothetical protein